MSAIDFYYMPESNPCQTVALVASLLEIPLNLHKINLSQGEHLTEKYLKINPTHKVPFIVDGELKLGESRAIIIYLVNNYGPQDSPLYPSDVIARARIDELLFFDASSFYPTAMQLYRPYLFLGAKLDLEKLAELENIHQSVEDRIIANKGQKIFLTGNNLTLGDISIANTVISCHTCGFERSKFNNLTAFVGRVKAAIPKYHEITDEPTASIKKIVDSKLSKN